jgi:hypothetical protein
MNPATEFQARRNIADRVDHDDAKRYQTVTLYRHGGEILASRTQMLSRGKPQGEPSYFFPNLTSLQQAA